MADLDRITRNPEVMGGEPCLRGMRVTVQTFAGLVAAGHSIIEFSLPTHTSKKRQAMAYADSCEA